MTIYGWPYLSVIIMNSGRLVWAMALFLVTGAKIWLFIVALHDRSCQSLRKSMLFSCSHSGREMLEKSRKEVWNKHI